MQDKNKKNVLKAGIGYTIGNYLLKGIGLITVPLFSRLLTTEDYGIYNTFLAYEAILYIFISVTLHSSLKNARLRYADKLDEYTSSVSLIPLINTVILICICIIFRSKLSSVLDLPEETIIILIIYSYCSGLIIFYRHRLALDYDYTEYLKVSLFNVLCSVALSLYLIFTLCNESRYLGRIIGGTISYVIISIYIMIKLFKKAKPKFNAIFWKYGLRISAPLIPHGLSQVLLLQFDKIMINKIIGASQAGIYSFAYTLYSLVQILATSINSAFEPWAFDKMRNKDYTVLKKTSTMFVFIIGVAITGVMFLAPEAITILGGNKYKEAYQCVLPILFAAFFSMAYYIPAVIEYYHEKTGYIAIGTICAGLVNVSLNFVVIPKFGYVSAAYTTLVSYSLYFILHVVVSRKLSGFFIIDMKFVLTLVFCIGITFLLSNYLYSSFLFRILFMIIILLIELILIMKYLGKKDVQIIKNKILALIKIHI